MTQRNRKQDAAYGAAGAAAGGAAAPARSPGNRAAASYFQNLGEGTHNVPRGMVQSTTTGTGPRLQNRRYTASLARHIGDTEKKGGSIKPSRFAVYDDGVVQVDGAHRIWARSMKGDEKIPVNVTRVKGSRPANKPAAAMAYKHGKAVVHRGRVRRSTGTSPEKLAQMESKMSPRAKAINMASSKKSEVHLAPPKATKLGVLRAKQAGIVGVGTLAGLGASKLKGPPEKKVKKNMNPFGVESHEISKKEPSDRYKAAVWNADLIGPKMGGNSKYNAGERKQARKIMRREQWKGQAKGAAVGAGAGAATVGAIASRGGGKVGRLAYDVTRTMGGTKTQGAKAAGKVSGLHTKGRISRNKDLAALGTAGGAVGGQTVGDYQGRHKGMKRYRKEIGKSSAFGVEH